MSDDLKYKLCILLKNYHDRIADEEFIKLAITLIVKDFKLENYVNNIIYIKSGEETDSKYGEYTEGLASVFGHAAYVKSKKEIVIYERNFLRSKEIDAKENDIFIEKNFFINLLVLQTLLHEIEHANQYKKINESKNAESDLLRLLNESNYPETSKSYDVSPFERDAEIKSIDQTIELAEALHLTYPGIYGYLDRIKSETFIHGYAFKFIDDYIEASPIKQYAVMRNIDLDLLNDVVNNLSDEEYDLYGCPITYDELEIKSKRKEKVR